MTFGEKLYRLRKAKGLSQEALAEKLNTSRQAVSKWENNNGYPETEKIILISRLFEVTLDNLLIDEDELDLTKTQAPQMKKDGYYVSRETADGFLLYYKKKFLLLAAACGIVPGCNAVSYTSTEYSFFISYLEPLLTTISVIAALAIAAFIILKQNPYRVLRKKELVFAEDVRNEIAAEYAKLRKILVAGIILGLIILFFSEASFNFGNWDTAEYSRIISRMIFSMVLTGTSCFIVIFCIGIHWSYSILLRNYV